jgi:hypothetical protein
MTRFFTMPIIQCPICGNSHANFTNDERQWETAFYQSTRFPTLIIHGSCIKVLRRQMILLTKLDDSQLEQIPFIRSITPLMYDVIRLNFNSDSENNS